MIDYLGVAGLVFILAGWVSEFFDLVREKKQEIPLQFALLYGAGSLLLTIHSMNIGDSIFILLNAAATLIAAANVAFALARKKPKGKGKR